MYEGAIAGMILFGIYGGVLLASMILGWRDLKDQWYDTWPLPIITIVFILGFGLFWNARNEVLKREPIMSSVTKKMGNMR